MNLKLNDDFKKTAPTTKLVIYLLRKGELLLALGLVQSVLIPKIAKIFFITAVAGFVIATFFSVMNFAQEVTSIIFITAVRSGMISLLLILAGFLIQLSSQLVMQLKKLSSSSGVSEFTGGFLAASMYLGFLGGASLMFIYFLNVSGFVKFDLVLWAADVVFPLSMLLVFIPGIIFFGVMFFLLVVSMFSSVKK